MVRKNLFMVKISRHDHESISNMSSAENCGQAFHLANQVLAEQNGPHGQVTVTNITWSVEKQSFRRISSRTAKLLDSMKYGVLWSEHLAKRHLSTLSHTQSCRLSCLSLRFFVTRSSIQVHQWPALSWKPLSRTTRIRLKKPKRNWDMFQEKITSKK